MENGTQMVDCGRCGGLGIFRSYMHIDNGRCYLCLGRGKIKAGRTSARGTRGTADPVRSEAGLVRVRTWYANARDGMIADLADLAELSGWTIDAIKEALDYHGATVHFRALGWEV
jgi:hypothetical protein